MTATQLRQPIRESVEPEASLPLPQTRVCAAKTAYTTRHVEMARATRIVTSGRPHVGDLVLARVVEIGQHTRIERPDGRRARLFVGDEIIVVYGNRYAPDQFEAVIPEDLGPCELVAAGGVAAVVRAAHERMLPATRIEPIGLLADERGNRIRLCSRPLSASRSSTAGRTPIVAVVGSSMNSGKTTSAATLTRGLVCAGYRVGAAKVTGTGAGGDVWMYEDAGAIAVYDFTDAGYPSTYLLDPEAVRGIFFNLTDRLSADGCDIIVLEVADGIFQRETVALLEDPTVQDRLDDVVFAARDAVGALAGVAWLTARGLPPRAISGVLTAAPLAVAEAEQETGLPVWHLEYLADPEVAARNYADLAATQSRRP